MPSTSNEKLYHRRTDDFRGTILHPLSQLKDLAPDLYQAQRAKYQGREVLMDMTVPYLNCLWNDVVHLLPVHPAKLKEVYHAEGFEWKQKDWFEIDPAALKFSSLNSVIFLHLDPRRGYPPAPPEEFEPFAMDRIGQLVEVPHRTRECYREARAGKGTYFLFSGIPHVLYKGSITVGDTPVIRV